MVRKKTKIRLKKPRWSLKTSFWGAISIAVVVSPVVIFFLKKSIWIELEIIVGVLSFIIFLFLYYVLYHGVRFDTNEKYSIEWSKIDLDTIAQLSPPIDTGGHLAGAGAESGILGLIIGLLLDILISIVLSFLIAILIWIGLNVVVTAIIVLFLPLFYIFRRSLCYIVAKGRRCYGDNKRSFLFALRATVLNTFWLYIIILSGHYISEMILKTG